MDLTGERRKNTRQSSPPGHPNILQSSQQATEDFLSPEATPKRPVRSQTVCPTDTTPRSLAQSPVSSKPSLLSMFSRNAPVPVTPAEQDELLNMNVEEVLCPDGPSPGKTYSPAAYKSLHQQATDILRRMQNAYRQNVKTLSALEKEREAERDELEEAETRAKHLRLQLQDMAHKDIEQRRLMEQAMEELVAERRILKRPPPAPSLPSEMESTTSEDLGVDDADDVQGRKIWRESNGTDTIFGTDNGSTSSGEGEGEGESVFSRPRSPRASNFTTTARGVADGCASSAVDVTLSTLTSSSTRASHVATKASAVNHVNRKSAQQMSAFQRLMKGISGDGGSNGCRNCQGQDASVAWGSATLLRDENQILRSRVAELEHCMQGALDAMDEIRIP